MAYTLRYSLGNITVDDGTADSADSSLFLPGKNYVGYGQGVDQNFVSLLENFASAPSTGPTGAIPGQLWFDRSNTNLYLNTSNSNVASWSAVQFAGTAIDSNNIYTVNVHAGRANVANDNSSGTFYGQWATAANAIIGGNLKPGNANGNTSIQQIPYINTTGTYLVGNVNLTFDQANRRLVTDVSAALAANIPNSSSNSNGGILTSNIYAIGLDSAGGTGYTTLANIYNLRVRNDGYIANLTSPNIYNSTINGGTLNGVTISGSLTVPGGVADTDVLYTSGSSLAGNANLRFDYSNSIFYISSSGTTTASGGTLRVANIQPHGTTTGNLGGNWSVNTNFTVGNQLTSTNITSGSGTTAGALTGRWGLTGALTGTWTMASGSTLDTLLGTLKVDTITTGATSNSGSITGNWALASGSNLDVTAGNLILSNIAPSGGTGALLGNWTITAGNRIDTTAGELWARTITTGSVSNIGNITGNWTLTTGSRLNATYADIAERYAADAEYQVGTVVELGGEYEVTQVRDDLSDQVFGVVSNTAAYLLNAEAGTDATHPPIALAGRVNVRVVGPVSKGNRLVSAGNGYARAAKPDEITLTNVVGRALEDKQGDSELVLCAVSINI